ERSCAGAIAQIERRADLDEPRRSEGFDDRGLDAELTVAIEVLLECRLERLERRVGARDHIAGGARVTAIGGDSPHDILASAAVLPGDLIAIADLLDRDRLPRIELAGDHGLALELQHRTVAGRVAQEVFVGDLIEPGIPERLERRDLGTDL